MNYSTLLFRFSVSFNQAAKDLKTTKRSLATVFFVLVSLSVSATVYNVTTTTDGNAVNQLRGAITAADAAGGTHTVNVPAGTYNLTMGAIRFGNRAENITIVGAGSSTTIINMTTADRILFINPSGTVTDNIVISISGMKLQNADLNTDNFGGGAVRLVGPNISASFTQCAFDNNRINPARNSAGGAIRCASGGTLIIDQCTFTGNSVPGNSSVSAVGGAVFFQFFAYSLNGVPQYTNSNVSITNSTFTNNSVGSNSSTSSGGAIFISSSGGTGAQTFVVNITENNFINNSAVGSGKGGAIGTINSFAPGNTWNINYNRFVGNTASFGSALSSDDVQGNINATNNWWGCNSGPTSCADKAERASGSLGGTLTATPYLQLRTSAANTTLCSGTGTTITSGFTTNSAGTAIAAGNLGAFTNVAVPVSFSATLGTLSNQQTTIQSTGTATATYTPTTAGTGTVNAVVDNVPSNDATARASITINSAPTITDQPDNTSACVGSSASFTVVATGTGTLSYQWFKGVTPINGATGTTYTINPVTAADAATNYNVRVSSTTGCGPAQSNNASLTVNSLPAITDQPDNTSACVGSSASFTVTATGSGTLSYQWYKGAAIINGATGSTYTINSVTAADAAANYNVRVSSTTGCTPATSANASLTVNTAPSFTAQPTVNPASGICTGSTVTLSASYTSIGSATSSNAQWFKGTSTTPLNTGNTGTGSTVTVVSVSLTSAFITIANVGAADSSNYYLRINSQAGCGSTTSNLVLVNVRPPFLPTANVSATKNINQNEYVITDASCNVVAAVQPSGASPVNGNVTASVKIDPTVQTAPGGNPYAQRHYDIVPANNASTATATIKLYFTQAEFTAYNNAPNSGSLLPVSPNDAANKSNLRIIQYHGTGTAPGNYTGTAVEINPDDANIVYNGIYGRWEVTFSVTGFSGFYLTSAGNQILPLQLISFTGFTDGSNAMLQWKTTDERNVSYFEIERSTDAVRFIKVGQANAGSNNYGFTDKPGGKTVYYYRLKIVDKDSKISYSHTIAVNLKKAGITVQALPNPFTDKLMLSIASPQQLKAEIRLTDVSGKTLLRKIVILQTGTNAITLNEVNVLNKGTYILQVVNEKMNEIIKVIKAD